MKKITLILAFLTYGVQAQNFPAPYCNISNSGTITEEITSVQFESTSIINTDITSILVNKTAIIADAEIGQTYYVIVKGDTKGNFANKILAFIDWNHNDILDDAGEIYDMGNIINSNGNDEVIASMNLLIPQNALLGSTRVRISKIYTDEDSPAIVDPCAIEMNAFGMGNFPGYGQALDFTLQIGTLGIANFDFNALSVYPVPTADILNISYKSAIDNVKIYNLLGQEVFSQNINSANSQINIASLTAGNYIVKLSSAEFQHSIKIQKL